MAPRKRTKAVKSGRKYKKTTASKKKARAAKPAPKRAARRPKSKLAKARPAASAAAPARPSPRRSRKPLARRGGSPVRTPAPRQKPAAKTIARGPYDADLDRNPANYQPLTPLTFLERAASVFPDAHRHRPRQPAVHLCGVLRPRPPAGVGAGRGTASASGDTVAVMLANTPADAGGALRRADDGRRAQHAQHPARCRRARLHPRSRRSEGADHRPRIRPGDRRRR